MDPSEKLSKGMDVPISHPETEAKPRKDSTAVPVPISVVSAIKQEPSEAPLLLKIPAPGSATKRAPIERPDKLPIKKQRESQPVAPKKSLPNLKVAPAILPAARTIQPASTLQPSLKKDVPSTQIYRYVPDPTKIGSGTHKEPVNKLLAPQIPLGSKTGLDKEGSGSYDTNHDFASSSLGLAIDTQKGRLVDSPSTESYVSQPSGLTSMPREASNFDAVQIELKNSLTYIKMGLILDGFDILAKVTDVVVNNCEILGESNSFNYSLYR